MKMGEFWDKFWTQVVLILTKILFHCKSIPAICTLVAMEEN